MLSAFTRSKRRCGRGDGLRSQRQQVFVFCWIFLFFYLLSFLPGTVSFDDVSVGVVDGRPFPRRRIARRATRTTPGKLGKTFYSLQFSLDFLFPRRHDEPATHFWSTTRANHGSVGTDQQTCICLSFAVVHTRLQQRPRFQNIQSRFQVGADFFLLFFKSMGEGRCLWTIYGSSLSVVRWGVGSFPWKPVVVVDYKSIVVGFSR